MRGNGKRDADCAENELFCTYANYCYHASLSLYVYLFPSTAWLQGSSKSLLPSSGISGLESTVGPISCARGTMVAWTRAPVEPVVPRTCGPTAVAICQ